MTHSSDKLTVKRMLMAYTLFLLSRKERRGIVRKNRLSGRTAICFFRLLNVLPLRTLFIFMAACAALRSGAQPVNDLAFASHTMSLASSVRPATVSSVTDIGYLIENKKAGRSVLGYSKNSRPVEAYYFPGTSNEKALIIGGVHGSELSSVEVAQKIIALLKSGDSLYYNVVIIPKLFPDNADKALSPEKGPVNKGRYTNDHCADPNRQMPPLGTPFDPQAPFDSYERLIEKENQLLLQLIQDYKPSRIVNLHAIKDATRAGIYADPRMDCEGRALGFETDSTLALSMARLIQDKGGYVPGNKLDLTPTPLYYTDPCAAPKGFLQKRNLHGSALPENRGYGVSLGSWATTAVCGKSPRDAIQLITVEFPGYKGPAGYSGTNEKRNCQLNISLYAQAVVSVFLSKF